MSNSISIVDLLMIIKQRPGMYIGTKSLSKLHLFISGYKFAMHCENVDCGEKVYYAFNEWLAKKYNIRESILWDTYLLDVYNDQAKAFDMFFEELEVFLMENDVETPYVK